MLKKAIAVFGKSHFPFLLALLFSGLFFSSAYRPEVAGSDQLIRLLKLSCILFLLQFVAFSLLAASVRRHLAHERENLSPGRGGGLLLWTFVLYKEAVKTVFGVSMTLGWLAGMLFITDHFRDHFILVPVLLGLPFSAIAFLPAYLFAALLDHIPYPLRG
jgi:hypothetical protein